MLFQNLLPSLILLTSIFEQQAAGYKLAKAILVAKIGSSYDDQVEERYHFPKQYLGRVEQAVNDLIIYYEPRSNRGRLSYFAIGNVTDIYPDKNKSDHYYAKIENYFSFDNLVSMRERYELKLFNQDGSINSGTAQNAVRIITNNEFDRILGAGFSNEQLWTTRSEGIIGLEEEQAPFERPIVEQLTKRPYRDAKFRQQIQYKYDRRCAFTGLRLINGKGRPEVEAAHIRPVADNGPDSIRNGLALSGTMHWMFDRGLISLRNDFSFLCKEEKIPPPMMKLMNSNRKAIVPEDPRDQPHVDYLEYHRDVVFS